MTVLEQPTWTIAAEAATNEICIDDLRLGPSLREGGLDKCHIETLKELEGCWPPIVVALAERTVIDGLHRVHAARALGLPRLPCIFFAGGEEEAYAEFVRRNTAHGLPLQLGERQRAAGRLVRTRPEWSDRRIASICGLSPGTVARLRRVAPRLWATEGAAQLNARVGRDGRRRPLDAGALRARIAEALLANPRASLRAVATLVGTSPATVRSVRRAMAGDIGTDSAVAALLPAPANHEPTSVGWAPDDAVLSTAEGAAFAEWFTRTAVGEEWWTHLGGVPYGRIYDVADEARRRAEQWSNFARALEGRPRRA